MSDQHSRILAGMRHGLDQTQVRERGLPFATSHPSGVPTGYAQFRTDLGFVEYYDGTRWLSAHEYTLTLPNETTFSANGTKLVGPLRGGYSISVTQVTAARFVSTTNNATNYWTIQIRGLTSSYGGGTVIATTDTSAISVATWSILGATIGTPNPAENAAIDVNVVKSGSGAAPGNLILAVTATYRLIIP